jgi:hypothetical protein
VIAVLLGDRRTFQNCQTKIFGLDSNVPGTLSRGSFKKGRTLSSAAQVALPVQPDNSPREALFNCASVVVKPLFPRPASAASSLFGYGTQCGADQQPHGRSQEAANESTDKSIRLPNVADPKRGIKAGHSSRDNGDRPSQ